MPQDLIGLLVTAFALTGSPGPNVLSLAGTTAAFGRKAGARYMAGLCFGMLCVIAIVATGLAGLFLAIPGVAPVVTLAAAGYFLYLAWRIASAPPLGAAGEVGAAAPRWYEGMVLSLVNPKAYAAMAAVFSGHQLIADNLAGDALAKTLIVMAVIIAVNFVWLMVGAALTNVMRDPVRSRRINILFAGLLLLSVLLVVLT